MSSLKHALMRIGEPELQAAVGGEAIRYLNLLGNPINPSSLADILLTRIDSDLLLDEQKVLRDQMFDALTLADATGLSASLELASSSPPYYALKSQRFPIGSNALAKLSAFFSVDVPVAPLVESMTGASEEVVVPAYPIFDYQAKTINAAWLFLTSSHRRALIHMPTGAGKTRSAMVLICRMLNASPTRKTVVWLAHSEELCDQAADEFKKACSSLGTEPNALGRYYGIFDIELDQFDGGLIVASLSKLSKRSLSEQSAFLRLKQTVSMVVMDEAHQGTAPTYRHLLDMLAPEGGECALLGLSATPGRSWLNVTADQELARLFCRQKVTLATDGHSDPISFLQKQGYLAVPSYR
jgi:DNA repair protein RadD